jgi:transketolase
VRGILSARRREHIPNNDKPTFVCKRVGIKWGVAMLHGGREVHWWPLEEARREGSNMIYLANLAARPGELPLEELG